VTAIVRVTLADGNWHEDVGAGQGDNIKGKGACLDKVRKSCMLVLTSGKEGSSHRCDQASTSNIRKRIGELSVRQGLHERGGEGQGAASE